MAGKGKSAYEGRYKGEKYYWGTKPSGFALKVLEHHPPGKSTKLLDIGCGEGRNAVFFARNGYEVTAFDVAESGVRKTKRLAKEAGVTVDTFQADLTEYRLGRRFDIIFAHGVLQYVPQGRRGEYFGDLKRNTAVGGINALSVFVHKPFIPKAPDGEKTSHRYKSGELFMQYHDWCIERCAEEIFDCNSSGVPHKHATDKMVARKV